MAHCGVLGGVTRASRQHFLPALLTWASLRGVNPMSERRIVTAPDQEADGLVDTDRALSATRSDARQATSEWVKRAGYYATQAVESAERAHRRPIERRLDRRSRHWIVGEVPRTYRINADGERRFRDEAEVFVAHGYRPWLETHSAGDAHGGRLLLVADDPVSTQEPGARAHRSRHVTWKRDRVAKLATNSAITPVRP